MKIFLSFGAIIVIGLFFAGCSKPSGSIIDAGSMTATLGGASFTAASCYENVLVGTTESYYIQGTGTVSNTFVVLKLRGSRLHTGNYDINSDNTAWYIRDNATFYARSGTITINSDSAGIATNGSFNFVVNSGATAQGSFRAVFQR